MMILKDVSRIEGGGLRGAIYGDTRGRFNGAFTLVPAFVAPESDCA